MGKQVRTRATSLFQSRPSMQPAWAPGVEVAPQCQKRTAATTTRYSTTLRGSSAAAHVLLLQS
jgi:hypothetical protein